MDATLVNSIAQYSVENSQSGSQQQIQISLLKKAQDTARSTTMELINSIPPPPTSAASTGQRLNVYA